MDQNGDGASSSRAMAPPDANATPTAPELPDDVLLEILVHLPAKSILRFRAVCKPWRRLFSDSAFIRDHHRRAPRAILLNDPYPYVDTGAISALPFPYTDQSMAAPLYCGFAPQETFVEGCCDGLLLLSCNFCPPQLAADRKEYCYFVCNPATRELTRLPGDLDPVGIVGFYWHAPMAEYRVLYYNDNHKPYMHYEYFVAVPGQQAARRLGPSNLWTDTDWPLVQVPVTHRRCLHWMLRRPSMGMVVFDTISEKFRRMRGPMDDDTRMDDVAGHLVAVDGTLGASVFAKSEEAVKLWVLESYEEEAWAFRYNIDVSFLVQPWIFSISLAHVSDEGDAVLMPFGRKRVGVYNLQRGEVVSTSQDSFFGYLHGTDHVYQESLVSLAPQGVGDPIQPSCYHGFWQGFRRWAWMVQSESLFVEE